MSSTMESNNTIHCQSINCTQQQQQEAIRREEASSAGSSTGNSIGSNNTIRLRLLIDAHWAGVITPVFMRELRSKVYYNASISVNVPPADKYAPEGVLTIQCPPKYMEKCVGEVLSILRSVKKADAQNEGKDEVRMLVQQPQAEAIVCKSGNHLGLLRKQTQCHIRVASECCPGSTEHVCLICGHPDKLPGALMRLIDFLLKSSNPPSKNNDVQQQQQQQQQTYYDPSNYNSEVAYDGFGTCLQQVKAFLLPEKPRQKNFTAALMFPAAKLRPTPILPLASWLVYQQQQQKQQQPVATSSSLGTTAAAATSAGFPPGLNFTVPPPPLPPYFQSQSSSAAGEQQQLGFQQQQTLSPQTVSRHRAVLPLAPSSPPAVSMDYCEPPSSASSSTVTSAGLGQKSNINNDTQLPDLSQLEKQWKWEYGAAHRRQLDTLKRQLAKAELAGKQAAESKKGLEQELESMRMAQAEKVNLLAEVRASLLKEKAEREALEQQSSEQEARIQQLTKDKLGLDINLKLVVKHLQMERMSKNRDGQQQQNAAASTEIVNEEHENVQKVVDAVMQESRDSVKIHALKMQLETLRRENEKLKLDKQKSQQDLDGHGMVVIKKKKNKLLNVIKKKGEEKSKMVIMAAVKKKKIEEAKPAAGR